MCNDTILVTSRQQDSTQLLIHRKTDDYYDHHFLVERGGIIHIENRPRDITSYYELKFQLLAIDFFELYTLSGLKFYLLRCIYC